MEEEHIEKTKPDIKNWIIIGLVTALLLLGGYEAYNYYTNNLPSDTSTSTPTTLKTVGTSTTAATQVTATFTDGVTWITPEKLGDLGLFKILGSDTKNVTKSLIVETAYYKVGTKVNGDEIILAQVAPDGMGTVYDFQRFIKSSDKYSLITQNSDGIDRYDSRTIGTFTQDATTKFDSILPDTTITKGDTKLTKQGHIGISEARFVTTSESEIATTSWGKLYRGIMYSTALKGDNIKVGSYYIKLADSTLTLYSVKPTNISDDGVFSGVTWATATGNTAKFSPMRTSGCGSVLSAFPMVINETAYNGKKQAEDTSTHKYKIYSTSSKDNELTKLGYSIYNPESNSTESGGVTRKSIDDYWTKLGTITWTDDYGTTIIYNNQSFEALAECGKPVIYLYPEKTTTVSVKVGASITKSEPNYGNGWTAVANPNGQLTVGGKVFDSLFWEGIGNGEYPAVTSGTVVANAEVKNTITSQLSYIGLNAKETNDFLDFWMPKMPSTPYVRLSWLQNNEMDKLAPLAISPTPTSVIRVFLDFEGFNNQIGLPSQKLTPMTRTGFSVIEWGGLLK
jgi:hypothetical protein